jgi:hypothetical protein
MRVSDNMDLRAEMQDMINSYGFWVLVQRNSAKLHCTCWNEKYKEGLSTHTKCGGTGWVARIERHRTRHRDATIMVTEPNQVELSSVGRVITNQLYWYFLHTTNIRPGDTIYEVTWDPKNPLKPAGLIIAHIVNHVTDYRADNGQLTYRGIATRSVTTNMKIDNLIVRSIGTMVSYDLG